MMAGVVPEHELTSSNADHIESDAEDTILHGEDDLHIASEAEKKSFWWRNALINSFFILAWYNAPTFLFLLESLSTSIQVPFCDSSLRV